MSRSLLQLLARFHLGLFQTQNFLSLRNQLGINATLLGLWNGEFQIVDISFLHRCSQGSLDLFLGFSSIQEVLDVFQLGGIQPCGHRFLHGRLQLVHVSGILGVPQLATCVLLQPFHGEGLLSRGEFFGFQLCLLGLFDRLLQPGQFWFGDGFLQGFSGSFLLLLHGRCFCQLFVRRTVFHRDLLLLFRLLLHGDRSFILYGYCLHEALLT
mmetsp:Transcript_37119/g.79917  ORF Transcript_37119/g.79917 Transcript_37119/m.79917 type:complete len:211 (-) Transcript_37119:427-1059(-)